MKDILNGWCMLGGVYALCYILSVPIEFIVGLIKRIKGDGNNPFKDTWEQIKQPFPKFAKSVKEIDWVEIVLGLLLITGIAFIGFQYVIPRNTDIGSLFEADKYEKQFYVYIGQKDKNLYSKAPADIIKDGKNYYVETVYLSEYETIEFDRKPVIPNEEVECFGDYKKETSYGSDSYDYKITLTTETANKATLPSDSFVETIEIAEKAKNGAWEQKTRWFDKNIVIITNEGEKYHTATCSHIKGRNDLHALIVSNAVNHGYTPCLDCDPPREE